MLSPAYGARLLLAPAALGTLRLPLTSCEFLDGACHPFAAAEREHAGASNAR